VCVYFYVIVSSNKQLKKKSCPISTDDVFEKKLPVDQIKSPVSKSKTLNKNTLCMAISNKEEHTKLPEKKQIKPKKSVNSSNTLVNNDFQSSENNLRSKNNHKKKAKSSSKNIQESHPAFYFVRTLIIFKCFIKKIKKKSLLNLWLLDEIEFKLN